MRYLNTTPLQVGMTGAFLGKRYRIAGRVVMGMEEGGETYTWSEFNLIADDGSCATLVHEVTEQGVEWRMFTLIEPSRAITAGEAASRRVGDSIDVIGKSMSVTCVDESRVLYIEGEAPEGVDLGDVAHYFNAERGSEMIVVSWTGNEVEVYRGVTLPSHAVTNAFGVSNVPYGSLSQLRSGSPSPINGRSIAILVLVITSIGLGWLWVRKQARPSAPKLPPAKLAVGKAGEINGTRYHIEGRAAVEVARVGKRLLRHEYHLSDGGATPVLLAQGTDRGGDEWQLFTPLRSERALTPRQLAPTRLGDAVEFDGTFARVTEMFLSRVRSVEGAAPVKSGVTLYGLLARGGTNLFAVEWDETRATYYRLTPVSGKTVVNGFK